VPIVIYGIIVPNKFQLILPDRWWILTELTLFIIMIDNEVPMAVCVVIELLTSKKGSIISKAGTIVKPPPNPNKLANMPDKIPVKNKLK
jgi:hypothetical protein